MKERFLVCVIAFTLVTMSVPSHAQTDLIYYTIGGGNVISAPAREQRVKQKTIGVNWDMNLQCGNLDPELTVKNQLNGITDGFQDMMGSVLQNATSAVMSLPGYFIQKQDPGLYDLLTNGVLQSKFDFDNAKSSCEDMTKWMGDGLGSSEWAQLSQANAWTTAAKKGDAVQAKKDAEQDKGNSGVVWRGGIPAGGRNQQPIRITTDTAIAGFEILTEGQSKPKKEGLYRYWETKEELTEWVTGVIGDVVTQTGTDKSKEGAIAGIGLSAEVAKQTIAIEQELQKAMVSKNGTPSFPPSFIQALKVDPAREIIEQRVISEVALVQTIDKALLARRALIAGKKETYIAQNKVALADIDKSIALLEQDIELLRFEATVRQQFSSNIIDEVISRKQYADRQMSPDAPKVNSSFEGGKFGASQ
ncbi:integrating conjugative element protein [Shewanella sp. DC2-4]|uniref:integrating conjugative element protein n=1 Tax=Shewanella sp. DC2-4 TaxID=2739431 RepID=UPI00156302D0|nr:integrating conjugative element protein [Shewanella sp. DC2-4]NRD34617.1 integrating conjugative element protein [Shewanella sp. DC2-4]